MVAFGNAGRIVGASSLAMLTRTFKIELIYTLLHAGDLQRLRTTLSRLDEVQIAAQLDNLEVEDQIAVLQQVARERRPEILAAMRYEAAAPLVARLAPEEAAGLLDELNADDAVDILGQIDQEHLDRILSRLDERDADELQELLAYDEHSAGGIMSPEVLCCGPADTAAEALGKLQAAEELPDNAFHVYVIDGERRLIGVCSLRTLVRSRPDQPLHEVMDPEVVTVLASLDQEEVAEVVSRYDLVAVPVVDERHRLLGVIDVDDIVDVLREEATEDILKMAGAGEELVSSRSFSSSFKVRSRWLAAAALGGLVAAVVVSGFEEALTTVPALAFFMPVVAGMGGNVGTQSSTIVVRGLAVGFVETERIRRLVFREVSLGLTLGLLFGLVIALLATRLGDRAQDPVAMGAVVALGMVGSTTIAAGVGTCVPLILDRFSIDPAVATGPFVTTAVDVLGLAFYFWLASALLGVPL